MPPAVIGTLLDGDQSIVDPNQPPGAFKYYKQRPEHAGPAGLHFVCPCGCGHVLGVQFDVPETSGLTGAKWQWNGDRAKPTLTPSIRRLDGCLWHGYLTAGLFKSC